MGVLAQWECHIFKNRQISKQCAELKKHAHAPAGRVQLRMVHAGHIVAVK